MFIIKNNLWYVYFIENRYEQNSTSMMSNITWIAI